MTLDPSRPAGGAALVKREHHQDHDAAGRSGRAGPRGAELAGQARAGAGCWHRELGASSESESATKPEVPLGYGAVAFRLLDVPLAACCASGLGCQWPPSDGGAARPGPGVRRQATRGRGEGTLWA